MGKKSNQRILFIIKTQCKLAFVSLMSSLLIVYVGAFVNIGASGVLWSFDTLLNCLCVYCSFLFPTNVKLYHYACDCNGNKYLLCLCCYCCYCCNVRMSEEEIMEEEEKKQDVEMTDMDKGDSRVNTSSPKSTVSVEPKTAMRSFSELSPATLPGIVSKVALKSRTSGTATALSSTCKTASGRPGLMDRVTPYHAGLENSHGGLYENV